MDAAFLRPDDIIAFSIYPPIGVARVGNAEDANDPFADDHLLSPEVIGGMPLRVDGTPATDPADFRNPSGAIRRMGARFRVYAELRDGTMREIVAGDGFEIEWRVSLANLKAGWYEFNQAMDLPRGLAKPARRRNNIASLGWRNRKQLDITPAPRRIAGAKRSGPQYQFSDGTFVNRPIYLGELRTDEFGRLIVLGGRGLAAPLLAGSRPVTFANNDGWHDDIADGPVFATVRWTGMGNRERTWEARPGYVVVTPPNYAPGLTGVVTMDDVVRELFFAQGWLEQPETTSFSNDIWPIFARLTGMQWVNQGFLMAHGAGSPLDAAAPTVLKRLSDCSEENASWRQQLFSLFKNPVDVSQVNYALLPQLYGDAYGETGDPEPLAALALTPTQYLHLERWADGTFVDDWIGMPLLPDFDALPAGAQAAHLERAGLHDCLGGPFHPGIELTWTMRIPHLWDGAYRLKILGDAPARQDWGDELSPEVCTAPAGPFDGVAAGALTRFLGVPWQTDGVSCNSDAEYAPGSFLSMPSFWGARVPDQVLSYESFECLSALVPEAAPLQRAKHFALRSDWLRDLRGRSYFDRILNATRAWHELGIVLPVRCPSGPLVELRIEHGRPKKATGDPQPKLELMKAIDALAKPEGAPEKVQNLLAAAAVPAVPEPARHRQDEV